MHAAYSRHRRPPFFRPVVPCLKTGLLLGLLAVWIVGLAGSPGSIAPPSVGAAPALPPAYQASDMPLAFVPNQGQTDAQVAFEANISNGHIFFTPDEVVLNLERAGAANDVLRVQYLGANQAAVEGLTRISGQTSYMIGNDPDAWQTGLPHYGDLIYRGIYPGIDLHYTGSQGQLKSTFLLAAGANPALIGWNYAGATGTRIDPVSGNLLISMPGGEMVETAPIAWQTIGGEQVPVSVAFAPRPDGSIGFQVGAYNPALPLTIDPTLEFSSYLGGTSSDQINDVAIDSATGTIYVVGETLSTTFPGETGDLRSTTNTEPNIFVASINQDQSVNYVTIIGGNQTDRGLSIDVDNGRAFIAGVTTSPPTPADESLPLVNQLTVPTGDGDGFIMVLNAAGTGFELSTYFGGVGVDLLNGIVAVPAANGLAVVGTTQSSYSLTNFTSPRQGGSDILFSRIDLGSPASIRYGELIGSVSDDFGNSIDALGETFYLTGVTDGGNDTGADAFPITEAFQATAGSTRDAFVTAVEVTGVGTANLVLSSFLGGNQSDTGLDIAVYDDAGTVRAFVTGNTLSTNLPGATGTLQNQDAFFAALTVSTSPATSDYVEYLGSPGLDSGNAITVDDAGNVFVVGETGSSAFLSVNPLEGFEPGNGGGGIDAFVTRYAPVPASSTYEVSYSTRFGGSNADYAYGVATYSTVAGGTSVTVGGFTSSSDLPDVADIVQPGYNGGGADGFIAVISNERPLIDLNGADAGIDTSLTYEEQQPDVAVDVASTLTISDTDNADLERATVRFVADADDTASAVNPPDGTAERLDWDAGAVPAGITVSYSETIGLLTLEGPASLPEFEQVLRTVTYENTSGDQPTAGNRFLRFTVDDGLNTNSPFAYATVDFQPVNDAPSLTVPATFGPFDEDSTANSLNGMSMSDPDAPPSNGALTVTLSIPANAGSLSATPQNADGGLQANVEGAGTNELSISAAISDANLTLSLLDNVTFTPDPDVNGTIPLTVTLNDGGVAVGQDVDNSAFLGEPQIVTETATISVTPINDEPEFNPGDATITVEENSGLYSQLWATAVRPGPTTAVDEASQTLGFLVTVNSGAALLTDTPVISEDGTLNFTPALDANGTVSVTVQLQDNGSNVPPNDNISAPASFEIEITSVNNAPGFTSGGDVTVNEDSGAYNQPWATGISAGPPDESGQTLTFNETVVSGAALLSSGPTIDETTGDLSFEPAPDVTGVVTVSVTLSDDGGTANGGVDTSDPVTFTITINEVNDPPSFTGGGDVTVLEDSGDYSAGWATAISAGPPSESGQTLTFNVTVNAGAALLAGTPVISPDGTLNFTPANDAVGTVDLSVTLSDDGGGTDTSTPPVDFSIIINPVNDAPSFTSGGDVTVNEDSGAYDQLWATNILAGPSDESGQTLTFNETVVSGAALLSSGPTIDETTGNLSFEPAPDATGVVTVSVTLSDDGGTANGGVDTSDPVTFTITINEENDPPSFTDGGDVTVLEDSGDYSAGWATAISAGPPSESGQTLTFNVTVNAGAALLTGTPVISPDGTLNFTPAANANGTVDLSVTLSDDGGGTDTSAPPVDFSIIINPVNDAPSFTSGGDVSVAEDSGAYDQPWATGISAGPPDESGQTLTFNETVLSGATLLLSGPTIDEATGNLSFEPQPGASGVVTVSVTLSDDGGTANGGADTSNAEVFAITINAVNDPPLITVGTPTFTTNEDTAVNITGVTVDDPDAAPGELRLTLTVPTSAGTLSAGGVTSSTVVLTGTLAQLNTSLGNLSFDPATDYNSTIAGGDVTLDIDLNDLGNTGSGGPLDAQDSIAITITPINDAPVIAGDTTVTIDEDAGAQTITAFVVPGPGTATDEVTGQSFAAPGGITINSNSEPNLFAVEPAIAANGTLTFTPADNAYGTAVVNITITDNGDGTGLNENSTTTDFTVEINPVNDQPVFTGGGNPPAVDEDSGPQVVPGWATSIDSGVDPDEPLTTEDAQVLTFVLTPTDTTLFAAGPAVDPNTGDLTYTPADDAFGSTTVTVVLQDNGGTTNGGVDTSAPVEITITINPVNDDPSIVGDNPITLDEDSGPQSIAGWAIPGPDNESAQTLTYGLIVNDNTALFTAAGRPTVTPDGTLIFTTVPDGFGTANINFTLTDSEGATITETLTINVTEIEDPPIANDDPANFGDPAFSTDEDTPLVLTTTLVLANDTDAEDDPLTVTEVSPTSANGGSVTLSGTSITYTPAQDYNGTDTFTYTIGDGRGGFDSATVLVTVNPVNDAPVAVADTVNVLFDTLNVPIDVLANDEDVDNDPLQVTAAIQPTNGQVTISPDGSRVFYTPARGYEGPDSFEYTVEDPDGLSSTATVEVSVGKAVIYLPFVQTLPVPDLVGSVTVEPVSPVRRGPAEFIVTVTNTGTAPATNFWVDLYINPLRAPMVNERWNDLCVDPGDSETCIGLAWFIDTPVPPGGSIQLSSAVGVPNGFNDAFSRWPGFFNRAGVQKIYVYVDSWNRDPNGIFADPDAAVAESDENNNLVELDVLVQERPTTNSQESVAEPETESEPVREIPPRPAVNRGRD